MRRLVRKTGRYRSVSEFVAEAIRRRLEEIDNKTETSHESSSETLSAPVLSVAPVTMESTQSIEDKKDYINVQLQRPEQMCDLLVRFFEDIVLKSARVDLEHSHQLKNCRTLNFINSIIRRNCDTKDIESTSERLSDPQTILENMKRDFMDETECRGAPVVGVNEKMPLSLARNELSHIKAVNAQAIITGRPFSHMMFDTIQPRIERMFNETYNLPVLHYPQFLGLTIGHSPEELALRELRVDASKMVNLV